MNISIEISMYPLQDDYKPSIDRFLTELHKSENLKVATNNMSTQVFGDINEVFPAIQRLIHDTYRQDGQCPFVLKVLNSDVSENVIPEYK